jgi:16S rRNA (guanine527-N7)-methyltransferase
MTHPKQAPLDELFSGINTLLGRPASKEEQERFAKYLNLLLHWNQTHHLTAFTTQHQIIRGLFLDSLFFLPLLPPRPIRVVDIGSGTGIPGIPLRVVDPGVHLTLVEATRKRVSFLTALKKEIGIEDILVLHGRAEDLVMQQTELFEKYDSAVMRCVGSSAKVLPIAHNYLRPGGMFIASGPPQGTTPPAPPGNMNAEWMSVHVPALGLSRRFLIARKES